MKALLISTLFFLSLSNTFGQNYLPFPDSAAIWVNVGWYSGQGFTQGTYFCANGADTTINATEYTRLEGCSTGDYIGAFRDTAGQVYYVPNDSLSEFIMYDFSAQPGDTVNYYNFNSGAPGLSQVVVQWIDTWLINGVDHRVLSLDNSDNWIEGVGCNYGFLDSYFPNLSNYAAMLYCASVNDTIRYGYSASQNGPYVSCDFFIGLDELQKENITVYPNPTNDQLHFSIAGYVDGVILTDLTGRTFVMDYTQSGSEYTIRVEGLDAGVYSVMIRSEEMLYQSKVVVQ
jgi:hypothetical protein